MARRAYALPRFTSNNRLPTHRFNASNSIAQLYIPCSAIVWWDDLTMRLCAGLTFVGWTPGGSLRYKAKDDSYAMMVQAAEETRWLGYLDQVWLHLDQEAMDDYWRDTPEGET